jgi:hypothetical protein
MICMMASARSSVMAALEFENENTIAIRVDILANKFIFKPSLSYWRY